MTTEQYSFLFEKYLSGNATAEEEKLLLSYQDDFDIQDFDNGDPIKDQQIIKHRIFEKIEGTRHSKLKKVNHTLWWAVAASILFISTTGVILFNTSVPKVSDVTAVTSEIKPILPGGNSAILTLDNGSTIDLNEAANGLIAYDEKIAVTKRGNGQLVYGQSTALNGNDSKIAYNTISTPRGGQYQVILPDGTRVWLNAASSLKYPVQFKGNTRHVVLNGEAYFEVFENKNMPFTIAANKISIKVLGTHFNVMAYRDELLVKTTLLEGAVQLSNPNNQIQLLPGQQAQVENTSGKFQVNYVNTADAVAWKNGYFAFKDESMVNIMKKIARWYDVDVIYEDDVSHILFGGSISRSENIEQLLHKIELTQSVQFRIEGRRVIVKL